MKAWFIISVGIPRWPVMAEFVIWVELVVIIKTQPYESIFLKSARQNKMLTCLPFGPIDSGEVD